MAYFLSPALVRLRLEVNALWPSRSKASDGWIGDASHSARKSDHNPDYSAGGIVRAIDVTNAGMDVDAFVSSVIRDERTRYVITRGRIWTRDAGWYAYTGSNGHYQHVHVSVRTGGGYDLQVHSWGLSTTVGNNLGGGGSVSVPNVPGAPAPVTPKDWFDMATEADLRKVVTEVFTERNLPLAKQAEADAYLREIPHRTADAILNKSLDQGVGNVRSALEDARVISRRTELKVTALEAALGVLAKDRGLDAAAVTKAVQDAVEGALSDLKITLTTGA